MFDYPGISDCFLNSPLENRFMDVASSLPESHCRRNQCPEPAGADLFLYGKVGEKGFTPVRGFLSKDMVCRCLHDSLFLLVARTPSFSEVEGKLYYFTNNPL